MAVLLWTAIAPLAMARPSSLIEARLVIPDTKVLPGVPFDLWIELYNPSGSAVRVAVCPPLRFVPVDGVVTYKCNRACMNWQEEHWKRSRTQDPDAETEIAAGERRTLALPIRSELSGPKIEDEIGLSKVAGHTCAIAVQLCILRPKTDQPVITNEVRIEVIDPIGSDAGVWKLMNALTDDIWTTATATQHNARAMWGEVLTHYPDSDYVPYAELAANIAPSREELDRLLETIRRFPDSPVIELLHVRAWELSKSLEIAAVANAERAIVQQSKRPTTQLVACHLLENCR